ncbi:putative zinc finger protein, C2H2 type [Lyophyllum shimeji]|uniref:Zinc finger protein, C2H2 type n=1 Tax=Lyophyllum shimeji TaxID=47721 RepID=A0A9P3UI78_LYOSH|nr:putative zinc finger protein, C2H2 type [Lyophyllum shimeji]
MNSDEWTCQTCSRGFSRKGDLTRHVNIHAGYKPHKCSDCGKSFSQYSGLKTHRNVHTKIKPFLCGMNGCKAAFGDPSSRARHCKETHRTLGAYRCPVPRCKSSIKRRSAFTQHLRKHNLDPETVDIDALAPPLLPRHVFARRKSDARSSGKESSQQSNDNTVISPFTGNYISAPGPSYFHVPQLPGEHAMTYDWFETQPITLPSLPAAGLYTIASASPLPDFSYSASPSPAPPNGFLQTPSSSRGHSPYTSSSPSTPAPSPLSQPPLLFFSEPAHAEPGWQKSMTEWDLQSVFGTSHEQFQGING